MCVVPEAVSASRFPLLWDDKNDSFCRAVVTAALRCGIWVESTFEIAEVATFT